jgi:hypothetical protein
VKKNKRMLSSSGIDQLLGRTTKLRRLSRQTKDKIVKLAQIADKGAHDAAVELHSTAGFAVATLWWLCKRRPELFKGISREKFSWPVMYNPHPEVMRKTAEFLQEMELGKNTQINFSSGKTFSWRVPANVVALNLHKLAQSLRRAPMRSWSLRDLHPIGRCGIGIYSLDHGRIGHKYDARYEKQLKALEAWGQTGAGKQLPPLSKETAAQWATAAKELFQIAYPGNFEEHPYLQELRASVLDRAKDYIGKPGGRGIVRKAMLQALKQAWHSIAALD